MRVQYCPSDIDISFTMASLTAITGTCTVSVFTFIRCDTSRSTLKTCGTSSSTLRTCGTSTDVTNGMEYVVLVLVVTCEHRLCR